MPRATTSAKEDSPTHSDSSSHANSGVHSDAGASKGDYTGTP